MLGTAEGDSRQAGKMSPTALSRGHEDAQSKVQSLSVKS